MRTRKAHFGAPGSAFYESRAERLGCNTPRWRLQRIQCSRSSACFGKAGVVGLNFKPDSEMRTGAAFHRYDVQAELMIFFFSPNSFFFFCDKTLSVGTEIYISAEGELRAVISGKFSLAHRRAPVDCSNRTDSNTGHGAAEPSSTRAAELGAHGAGAGLGGTERSLSVPVTRIRALGNGPGRVRRLRGAGLHANPLSSRCPRPIPRCP